MAKKITYEVDLDTAGAAQEVKELDQSMSDLGDTTEKVDKGMDKVSKTGGGLGASLGKLGGIAKGLGMGLLMTAMGGVTQAMAQNQKVSDLLSKTWTGLGFAASEFLSSFTEGGNMSILSGGFWTNLIFGSEQAADRVVDLTNDIALLGGELRVHKSEQEILIEQQRQIRDDFNNDYSVRLAANEEISKLLDEHAQKAKEYAESKLKAAEIENNIKNNVESQVALMEAQAEYNETMVWIETQRSEQKRNQVAITKEQMDKEQEQIDKQNAAHAEEMAKEDEYHKKLMEDMQKEADLQDAIRDKRADNRRADMEAEWAMVDETAAVLAKVGELEQQAWLEGNMWRAESWDVEQQMLDTQYMAKADHFAKLAELWEDDATKHAYYSAQKDKVEAEYAVESAKREKAVQQAKINAIGQSLAMGAYMFEEGTAAHKAFAVAQAIMSTYQGATMALGSAPPPYSYILMAMTIAMGLVNVKKILSTKPAQGGGGGGATAPSAAPQVAPQNVGVVGGSGLNQLGETIEGALDKPVKAYSTTTDMNSAQALDRHVEQNATL